MEQSFISWCLEACFEQEKITGFQQMDAAVCEFLEDCSNSLGIPSEEINANIWELARNMTGFYFSFMKVSQKNLSQEERSTDIDTVLPRGTAGICAVVNITLSKPSIFRKAPWAQ